MLGGWSGCVQIDMNTEKRVTGATRARWSTDTLSSNTDLLLRFCYASAALRMISSPKLLPRVVRMPTGLVDRRGFQLVVHGV